MSDTTTQTTATTGSAPTSGATGGSAAPQASANIEIGAGQEKYTSAPLDTGTQTGGETGTQQTGEAGTAGQQTGTGTKQTQTSDQNRAFAQMRRDLEATQKTLKDRDEWVVTQYKDSHGIVTWEQYQAAVATQRQQEQTNQQHQVDQYRRTQEDKLKAAGYNLDEIREAMRTDPVFLNMVQEKDQLKSEVNRLKTEQEQVKQNEVQRKVITRILSDHEKLRKKYGDLVPESLDDLDDETVKLMKQDGLTLGAAWREANEDKVLSWAKTGATTQALKTVGSKDHLGTEKSGGTVAQEVKVDISPEKMRVYKSMFPGKSEAEIRRMEARYIKHK